LPLAALWNEQTGRFLVEDFTLSHVPSAGALGFLYRNQNDNRGRALVMGHSGRSLSDVDIEARSVARLLGAEALTGPAAKESVIHAMAPEMDVIHLAAHGSFEHRSPTFSYLALAPGDGHDGRLELHEVAELELEATNLVVLSACDTFLGELKWSDDLMGMTRAFLAAGSPAVVTSLWPIDDEASTVLMEGFYRHLLTSSSSAKALRQAQIEMMSVAKWRSPYYWAAFVLTGDPTWTPPMNKVEARVSTPRN
jgi:CHAT domain-containing protein